MGVLKAVAARGERGVRCLGLHFYVVFAPPGWFLQFVLKRHWVACGTDLRCCPEEDLNISGNQYFINKYRNLPEFLCFEFHLRSTYKSAYFIKNGGTSIVPIFQGANKEFKSKPYRGLMLSDFACISTRFSPPV